MEKNYYILVADSDAAKLYSAQDALLTGMTLVEESRSHGTGGDHSHHSGSDPFARNLGQLLHNHHHAGKFTDLMIAAPPHFLGEVRKHLSKDCEHALGKSVHKNLVHSDVKSIIDHFTHL